MYLRGRRSSTADRPLRPSGDPARRRRARSGRVARPADAVRQHRQQVRLHPTVRRASAALRALTTTAGGRSSAPRQPTSPTRSTTRRSRSAASANQLRRHLCPDRADIGPAPTRHRCGASWHPPAHSGPPGWNFTKYLVGADAGRPSPAGRRRSSPKTPGSSPPSRRPCPAEARPAGLGGGASNHPSHPHDPDLKDTACPPRRPLPPSPPPASAPPPPPPGRGPGGKPTHVQIAERAYFISLRDGGADEFGNWLRAERELTAA